MGAGQEECLSEATLRALLADELDAEARAQARAHLDRCAACRQRLAAQSGATTRTLPMTAPTPPPAAQRPSIAPGTWIGSYEVDGKIGAGGMGVVYRGLDRSLDRPVAIKLLDRTEEEPERQERARMERESRTLARLSHRNVVTVYQVGEHEGRRYLAMEYVEGGTVRDWLASAPRSVRDITDAFAQAGAGLAAVHEAGFIHRDIKPDNLLIGSDGRVRVGDFGLVIAHRDQPEPSPPLDVARASGRLTQTGALMGTPRYMAPEVLRGEPADEKSDQWSFCASMWEALSGAPAFPGDLVTALDRGATPTIPAEPDRASNLPRRHRRLLLRGLAHDPAERWPSMRALVAELTRSRRLTTTAILAAGAAGAVALGLTLAQANREPDPCADAGAMPAWSEPRRAELARTLRSAPNSDPAARSVEQEAATYADSWRAARRAACRNARRQAPASPATVETTCLDERRTAFEASLAALTRAPVDPIAALELLAALPPVADCTDATWLADRQPPASDPTSTALRAELEAARAELHLGRAAPADRQARSALEKARRRGPGPLLAETLRLAGQTASATGSTDALPLLEEALTSAEAAGDDVLAANIWADLLDLAGKRALQRDTNRWLRHARALATRLDRLAPRAHDRTLADLATAESHLHQTRGALDQAETTLRESLARESTSGSTTPRLARAHHRLAKVLSARGNQAATDERNKAESLARALVGPASAARLLDRR
jgi:hypothetical protein